MATDRLAELAQVIREACIVVSENGMMDAVQNVAGKLDGWLADQKQSRAVLVAAMAAAIMLMAAAVEKETPGPQPPETIQ